MAEHVTTFSPRITFVKGWVTGGTDPADGSVECGEGTDYPMLVTIDQLAEIMYRVRDAWFTSGSAVYSYVDGEGLVTATATTAVQGTPIAQLVNSINTQDNPFGTTYSYARAYNVSDTVSTQFDSYFGEEYTLYSYYTFRDCTSEIGIWYLDYGTLGGNIGLNYPSYLDLGFRCGFSHAVGCFTSYFGLDPAPSGFYKITTNTDYSYGGSSLSASNLWVIFTGEVAYVGDSPTSPTAQLYVGLKMGIDAGFYGINTSISYFSGTPSYDTGGKFVLGLAGGETVSCKLYSPDTYDSVSDFVLQAQEWWPYQDDNGNVWSPTTGLPV
jgi:hypothetical protein